MMKWYQRIPGHLLFVLITLQAFDQVRMGMNFALFLLVTMLVLVGMMSLSAPAKSRRAGRIALLVAATGPALIFASHLVRLISVGMRISFADLTGLIMLFGPSAALIAYVLVMTRPVEPSAQSGPRGA